MRDAFDFANQEDILKYIKRESNQARILTLMLQHVCNCSDFIQSYAKEPRFCTSSSITSLADVNTQFAARWTISAAKLTNKLGTSAPLSSNFERISSQLDGVATQLKWVSSQVSDAGT